MLNNLGRAGQIHQMKLLFEEMKSNGCEISRITLSNVMLWYYKAKDMRYVARHWNLLRREGTQPSTAIYASYIDFLARSRRFTKIAVIFEEMMRRDYLPSSRLYTVFIEHLVNAGKVEDAAKILELMQHMLVFPSRVTYKFIINGFAKTGKVERMLETLEEMREYFHKPAKQFMPAVIALQKAGMVNEAAVLMEEIQPKVVEGAGSIGPRVDENDDDDATDADPVLTVWRCASTSSFLFDICAFTNALHSWNPEVEKVLEHADLDWEAPLVMGILRRMRKMDVLWSFFHWLKDKVGYKHDSSSTAVLLEKILRSKETLQKKDSLVKDLFDGLKKDGMNFSIQLFNSVIRYYVSVGEPEKGRSIFNLIGAFDLEPNRFSYALLIQGFARNLQGKEATVFLQEMQKKGFPLDNTTCAEMINCLGRARKIDQAYALYCKMLDSDLKPGHFVYKALLTVYSNAGDYGMALKLYDDMRQAGITPTQDMYEVVTRILHKTGRHVDAQQLAEGRRLLNFFDGNKKVLQERLLQVLFTFMRGVKAKKISESA
ncbi:hypothetical protein KP509_36G054600 [Ceratopteris richardii]|nr:hypothetical protein KP509_1Z309600 [Ceratopteris richardii]KAH7281596.1 hypothetical protein KP509_36G054600 [Ceratopteris richardii]